MHHFHLLLFFLLVFSFPPPTTCQNLIVVILTHSRSSHLKKTLRSLISTTPPHLLPPLYLSIDPNPKSSRILHAASQFPLLTSIWQHEYPPSYQASSCRARIARHYNAALTLAFSNVTISHVVLLEDDLLFAPDFIPYILASLPHLHRPFPNATVCASGWNDNGLREGHAHDAMPTSFFPGLGWVVSRLFWEHFLQANWPGSPSAKRHDIVGIGWDFWLRVQFERYGWTCVTPSLPRVYHFGVGGANVKQNEAEGLFRQRKLANVSADAVDWEGVLRHAGNVAGVIADWQEKLKGGEMVRSVAEARNMGSGIGVLGYLREDYGEIAQELGLWPTPRGHLFHVLLLELGDGLELVLYDKRRGRKRFVVPEVDRMMGEVKVLVGGVNRSCDEECGKIGMECKEWGLEVVNECEGLGRMMRDGCRIGCGYETGRDLPGRVEEEAPLETGGFCLIVETGEGVGGKLDCGGRYKWTRRACGCVKKGVRKMEKDEL